MSFRRGALRSGAAMLACAAALLGATSASAALAGRSPHAAPVKDAPPRTDENTMLHASRVTVRSNPAASLCATRKEAAPSCRGASARAAAIMPSAPAGDRWPQISFGLYGNGTYADCTLAAVADLEQIYEGANEPLVASADDASPTADPFVADYLSLSGGTSSEGLAMTSVLNAWEQAPIAGLQISGYQSVAIDQRTVTASLSAGIPLIAWFKLPTADSNAAGLASAPWSTSESPSGAPTSGTHVGVIVGTSTKYLDIATWGYVQQVTWQWWATWGLQAWSVNPA